MKGVVMNKMILGLALATAIFPLLNGTANAVNVSIIDSALYSFEVSGTGPFPSIEVDLLFPGSSPTADLFTKADGLKFTIYDELGSSAFYSFGLTEGFTSISLNNYTVTFSGFGFNPPFPDNDGYILIEATSGSFDLLQLDVRLGTGSDPFNPQFGSTVEGQLVTTAVPEPSTLSILVLSVIGLIGFSWFKRDGSIAV
jgi:hypothetical protein